MGKVRNKRIADNKTRRVKRGLIDIVGKASNLLFGTATEAEIQAVSSTLDEAISNEKILFHQQDKMLTIMNQTRKYLKENRMDISLLQRHVRAFEKHLEDFQDRILGVELRIKKLEFGRSVDQAVEELEVMDRAYTRQLKNYLRTKQELERGWLTENTLSKTELQVILAKMQGWGFETPVLEWYYENQRIEPFWNTKEQLIFRVKIPAMSRANYLKYKLHFFPVIADKEHLRTVKGHSEIMFNTETGAVFWPTDCFGNNPNVCIPGREIISPTCEKAIVTNSSLDLCVIQLTKKPTRNSDVYVLGVGHVVITPFVHVDITLRCSGKPATKYILKVPTEIIIEGGCKLVSKDWQVNGVKRGSNTIVRTFKSISYNRTLNFDWPAEFRAVVKEKLKFQERVDVPFIDIKDWKSDYSMLPGSKKTVGLAITMLIPVVIVIVVLVLYKRHPALVIRLCTRENKKGTEKEESGIYEKPVNETVLDSLLNQNVNSSH